MPSSGKADHSFIIRKASRPEQTWQGGMTLKRTMAGFAHLHSSHVMAMQGPFSRELNAAVYDQLRSGSWSQRIPGMPAA